MSWHFIEEYILAVIISWHIASHTFFHKDKHIAYVSLVHTSWVYHSAPNAILMTNISSYNHKHTQIQQFRHFIQFNIYDHNSSINMLNQARWCVPSFNKMFRNSPWTLQGQNPQIQDLGQNVRGPKITNPKS